MDSHDNGKWDGDALRRLRRKLGYDQRRIAHLTGFSRNTVGAAERTGRGSNRLWHAIAAALGTTAEALRRDPARDMRTLLNSQEARVIGVMRASPAAAARILAFALGCESLLPETAA